MATFRGTSNYAEFTTTWLLINDQIDGVDACYIAYSEGPNALYLVDDNGSSLLAANPQGSGYVENSQCILGNSGTSIVETGTDIVVTVEIMFKTAFQGPRILYMGAALDAGGGTGWHAKGAWTVKK